MMPDAFALGGRISLARVHAEIIQFAERHGRAPSVIEMTGFEWAALMDEAAWFLTVREPTVREPMIFGLPVHIARERA